MQFLRNIFNKSHDKVKQKGYATKSYNPFITMALGQDNAHWSSCDYYTASKKGYQANPIMHSCMRMIADGASRVPIKVMQNKKNIPNHPILSLLKSPSQNCNGRFFKNTLFNHLLLSGNAYIHCVYDKKETFPKAMFLLRPDRVLCGTDHKSGTVTHYSYQAGKTRKRYPAEHILHLKLFAPIDDYYGIAPTQAAWRAAQLHNEATIFQKALLDNAARPSGCLIYSGLPGAPNLTENQFMRLKSELQEHYAGAAAAGRPMVLEGGLEWKSMALSPNDMGISTLRHDAAREIALAYGVPPMLLGLPGDNTYSNYQEAIRVFTCQTLIPMAEIFYDAFSHLISKKCLNDIEIQISRDEIPKIFTDYLT